MKVMDNKATRYNQGKPRWSLVDHESLEPLVRVLEFGETKYGRWNWKKGLDKTEILESLYRHLIKLMAGQELDEETNLHHIGHIMSNAMFYSYFNKLEENKIEGFNNMIDFYENHGIDPYVERENERK